MLMVGICHVTPRSKVVKGSGVHVKLVFTVFPQFGSGSESRIVVFMKAEVYALVVRLGLMKQLRFLPWAFMIPAHWS